jgi:3-dehydroquinate synthase
MSNVTFHEEIETLKARLQELVKPYSAVFIICDENTEAYCLPLISGAFAKGYIISVHSGEQHKNLESCTTIWSLLTKQMADRKALLINLGGGVICDMGGFAASCYKRGIDFLHIPTTLLAMVDASVGGKTGIDYDGFKNQIGVFREAKEVLICPMFLETLEDRQIRSGMAEVIKHYLIADADAFHEVARSPQLIPDRALIEKAVAIKTQFVTADPFEKNVRKTLNFGHTIGHAIESHYLTTDQPLLHGEAIAIGMAVETIISHRLGLLAEDAQKQILDVLKENFDLRVLPEADIDQIVSLTAQDKKNEAGSTKFVLLTGIGSCAVDVAVHADVIRGAIVWYNNGK